MNYTLELKQSKNVLRPMKKKKNDDLTEMREELIAELTAGQGNRLDNCIEKLLEVERELTLREY